MSKNRETLQKEGKRLGVDIDENPEEYTSKLRESFKEISSMDNETGQRILCGINTYLRANPEFLLPEDVQSGMSAIQDRFS